MSNELLSALVAEPDPECARVLVGWLREQGIDPLRAATPREALDLLLSRHFDMAIVCHEFPEEAPGALLMQVTGRWRSMPVIVTTECPSVTAAVVCLKSGALDYIGKPIDRENLDSIIATIKEETTRTAHLQTRELALVEQVIGNYRILEELGSGALSTVYRAQLLDDPDSNYVALKILRGGIDDDETRRVALERFVREAEIAAEISQPNIVKLVDYGLATDSLLPYIAYELIEGRSLSHYITARNLPLEMQLRLLEQAAVALTAIHDAGIVHRDFKPDNMFVTPELQLKVSDFGVSRRSESDLTQADCTVGTPFYLAPESLAADPVSFRADQFSLGCVAYELTTGKRPFPGNTLPEIIRRLRSEQPVDPCELNPDLPEDLAAVIMQLLEKDPADRFADCRQVEAAFRACRRNLPLTVL